MKIASFTLTTSLPGGIEKICVLLASHWAQIGHKSDIINFAGDTQSFFPIPKEVSVHHLAIKKNYPGIAGFLVANIRRIIKLRRLFKSSGYDTVVCHGPIPLLVGGLAALGIKVKIISYPHMVVEPTRNFMIRSLQYIGFFFSSCIVLQTRADQIFVPSCLIKRIVIIPNLSEISTAPNSLRIKRTKMLLAVGNLRYAKNYPLLIRAFADSGIAHHGWKLKIAGGGDVAFMDRLKDVAKSCHVEDAVCFLGSVADVQPLYQESSLFVNSSNTEGMSVALMQALLHGIPVVATDCSNAQRELICNNQNGFLVPINAPDLMSQALKKLAEDDALRESMSYAALKSSEAFSPSRVYSLWDNLISST